MISDVERFFMSHGHLCVLFREMSVQVHCPFLNQSDFLVLSCMSFLLNVALTNVFSPLSRLSLHFIDGFLHCENLFSVVQYHLFPFSFVSLAQGDISKNILLGGMSKSLLCMCSSGKLWFQV